MSARRDTDDATGDSTPPTGPGRSPGPDTRTVVLDSSPRQAPLRAALKQTRDKLADKEDECRRANEKITELEQALALITTTVLKEQDDRNHARIQLVEKTDECQRIQRRLTATKTRLARHLDKTEKDRAIAATCIDQLIQSVRDTESKVLAQHNTSLQQLAGFKADFTRDFANLSWALRVTTPPITTPTRRGATPTSGPAAPVTSPRLCYPHYRFGLDSWACTTEDCPMRQLPLAIRPLPNMVFPPTRRAAGSQTTTDPPTPSSIHPPHGQQATDQPPVSTSMPSQSPTAGNPTGGLPITSTPATSQAVSTPTHSDKADTDTWSTTEPSNEAAAIDDTWSTSGQPDDDIVYENVVHLGETPAGSH